MVLTLLTKMIAFYVRFLKIEVREAGFQWFLTNPCYKSLVSIQIFRSFCRSSSIYLATVGVESKAEFIAAAGMNLPSLLPVGTPIPLESLPGLL